MEEPSGVNAELPIPTDWEKDQTGINAIKNKMKILILFI
jgi:hypothetical protein